MKRYNYRLDIQYEGTNFAGWQSQSKLINSNLKTNRYGILPEKLQNTQLSAQTVNTSKSNKGKPARYIRTVQSEIESVLSKIVQEPVRLYGAARTDTGVHAKQQVANFYLTRKIDTIKLHKSMNLMLPKDVVITSVKPVPVKFHARYPVKNKVYEYTIYTGKTVPVFYRNLCWHLPLIKLDFNILNNTAKQFVGVHDFSQFANRIKQDRNPICKIYELDVLRTGNWIKIRVNGDRFLYKMVRRIVAYLIQVNVGKNKYIPILAPAKGLCLLRIKY